jgi:DNA-binding NtrC family response regulator
MPLTQLLLEEIRSVRLDAEGSGLSAERFRRARLAARAARSGVAVLIESEPGAEAAALARAIHLASDRRDRPLRRYPDDPPPGGTLLVENAQSLDPAAQGELLRILQAEPGPAIGRRAARPAARIIATASGLLADQVRLGSFREDLYYRLQVLPISIPPLRARRSEIPLLAELFLRAFAREEAKPIRSLTPEAVRLLQSYDWPGNTRQLENAVFRAVALAEGNEIGPAELPQIAARVDGRPIVIPPAPVPITLPPVHEPRDIAWRDPHALSLLDSFGDVRPLAELEGEIIRFAIEHYRGHMSAVSRRLGIGRSTLYRKLKELGLENSERGEAA